MVQEFKRGEEVEVSDDETIWYKAIYVAPNDIVGCGSDSSHFVFLDVSVAEFKYCRKRLPDIKDGDPVWFWSDFLNEWEPINAKGFDEKGRLLYYGGGRNKHTCAPENIHVATRYRTTPPED